MNPKPPPELEDYQNDQASAKSPLPVVMLGWLSLLAFVLAVLSSVFLSGDQKVKACQASYSVFIVLFIAYVVVKILKRHSRCSRCGQIMDTIDAKWTPDEWLATLKHEMIDAVTGADGYLYTTETTRDSGSLPRHSIWAQLQVWCACHKCRRYFLKALHSRRQVLATRDTDEFDKARDLLIRDPKAGEAIESAYRQAYEAVLQGKRPAPGQPPSPDESGS